MKLLVFFGIWIVITMVASGLSTPLPSNVNKVAVIGATGRLGRTTVQQLVDRGISCKLLIRNGLDQPVEQSSSNDEEDSPLMKKSRTELIAYLKSNKGVELVSGDVGNVSALQELLKDCDACLAVYGSTRRSKLSDMWKPVEDDPTHAKQINYQGVINILNAAKGTPCKRVVRITGKGEDPTSFFSVAINMLGSMAKAWNYQGELALRNQSDIEYTIIRPGIMSEQGPLDGTNDSYRLTLADDGGDLKVSKIRYADIAALCIESLGYPNAARSTLTAITVDKDDASPMSATSWGALLAKVQPDRRVFPTDMLQQHKAAVRSALIKIGVFGSAVGAVILAMLAKVVFSW